MQQIMDPGDPASQVRCPCVKTATFSIWCCSRECCHKATSSGVGIGNHLYHHLVATGYERSRSECAAEAPDALAIGVAVVHIHEVIATQVVILEVYESKIQDDHFALRNLSRKKKKGKVKTV